MAALQSLSQTSELIMSRRGVIQSATIVAMGLALSAGRLHGTTAPHVIVDEFATLTNTPRLPASPAEQDGAGLRPNRKARRRTASNRK
jgi:hypothetical protein